MNNLPKGIATIAKTVPGQYALLLFLDGYPYVEFTARKHADFLTDLNAWKRKTYSPSPAPSSASLRLLPPAR